MRRRLTAALVASLIATSLGLLGLYLLSAEDPAPDRPLDLHNGRLRVCHVSDFHAAIERRADRVGKQLYMRCPESKYSLSKAAVIRKLLAEGCDLRIFTGDVMHGGDYDLLDLSDASNSTGRRTTRTSIASQLLPFWGIDLWTAGNHDLSSLADLKPFIGANQPPLVLSNLKTEVAPVLPFKKIVLTSPVQATICVFGLIRPELVDAAPSLFAASESLSALETAYQESLSSGCGDPGTLVILLSHSGWNEDLALIRAMEASPRAPRVSLLLGGHTHSLVPAAYPYMVNDTALSHVGAYGGWVGVITLQASSTAPARKFQYIPWSNGKLAAQQQQQHHTVWQINAQESRRISTRYRIIRRQADKPQTRALSQTRRYISSVKRRSLIADEEPEHGYYIRDLQTPALSWNKSVHDYTLMTYKSFRSLCQTDNELLAEPRRELESIIGSMTKLQVARLPPTSEPEESVACRRGQCKIGSWLGYSLMLAPTVTNQIALECSVSSVASKADQKTPTSAEPASLAQVKTVLGAVQAGVIRSRIPPECESVFEMFAGGCQLGTLSERLDSYDIERILPFHNTVRVIVLKNLDSVCDILNTIYKQWRSRHGSFVGVLHFGSLRYFAASTISEPSPPNFKGRRPFFDQLWELQPGEVLGAELVTLQGEHIRGVCHAADDGAAELRWRCLAPNCEARVGRIMVLASSLLLNGADGEVIRWQEHADTDFLRSVASRLVPEVAEVGCWLDALRDFTLNDAATLFLNASIPLSP